MTTTTISNEIAQLTKRISEIESEPRALIGSDEGTHGKPHTYRIYEEISGKRYAVKQEGCAGDLGRRTVEEAEEGTDGRIRMFSGEISRMAGLRAELAAAKKRLAKLEA